jgi:unsaturated rhamnogalacturonyl hydrolase
VIILYRQYGTIRTDWSTKAANTMINREPEMNLKGKWEYEDGLMLNGMYAIYKDTHNTAYLDYIKHNIDEFIADGKIKSYHRDEWSLDFINNGKAVLDLYDETHDEKYKQIADILYDQLLQQPRTDTNVFWHKQIYPNQIWLDGLYMGSVFYARYQKTFNITDHLEDVVHQFLGSYEATLDAKTGLCYHATDISRKAFWCDPQTGHSPHFWTRSIGWYVMAMVDVLEYLPTDIKGRDQVLDNLHNLLSALRQVADPQTNLWYQVTDEGDRPMNYLESSGSLMILNAIAKGLRMGYLDETDWGDFLATGYENALQQFISIDRHDYVNVNKIAHVGGLGGANKRDGSFAYYMSEPIVTNDHKGVGPFLLLTNEMKKRLNH